MYRSPISRIAWRLPSILVFCLAVLLARQTLSQSSKIPDNRLAVDVLKLKNGVKLHGFVLAEDIGKVTMAADRERLHSTYPGAYREYLEKERTAKKEAATQLQERIHEWIMERSSDEGLVAFLNDELSVIATEHQSPAAEEEPAESPRFILVELPRGEIRESLIQPAPKRKVGGLAYQYRLASPATTHGNVLENQLKAKGIDVKDTNVDISGDVPFALIDSPKQWAARRALTEYVMRKPLDYTGVGTSFVRQTDSIDVPQLVAKFGGGGGMNSIAAIGAELGLPEFKEPKPSDEWWRSICKSAEKDGFRGVFVTRLNTNPFRSDVVVEAFFFAMESPGNWFEVQRFRKSADPGSQSDEALERVKNDPQVKRLLESVENLGIADGSLLDKALRHGAAVQEAVQSVNTRFHLFKTRHTRNLRTPPIEEIVR